MRIMLIALVRGLERSQKLETVTEDFGKNLENLKIRGRYRDYAHQSIDKISKNAQKGPGDLKRLY